MEREYPRWVHHAKQGGKLVHNKEQEKALGEGWGDDSSVWRPHLIRDDVYEGDVVEEAKADEVLVKAVEKAEAQAEQAKKKPGRPAGRPKDASH